MMDEADDRREQDMTGWLNEGEILLADIEGVEALEEARAYARRNGVSEKGAIKVPFNRNLNDVALRELERLAAEDAGPNWWKDVLKERFELGWNDVTEKINQPLLLAVRDGYVNAYIDGQSVLKIEFRQNKLNAEIHWKYVFCDTKQKGDYLKFNGTSVTGFVPNGVDAFTESATLREWVRRAKLYSGGEKQGVAVIAARHSQIIDVEMALPGQTATRMDIVALEPDGDDAKIVFWEAKLFENPDIRANPPRLPKVRDQLDRYEEWINAPGREEEVINAYRRACSIYARLHAMRTTGSVPPIHPLIQNAAAEGSRLTVERAPGLIVFGGTHEQMAAWRKDYEERLPGIRLIMASSPHEIVLP